jgi:hemolysin activation/secretion protein
MRLPFGSDSFARAACGGTLAALLALASPQPAAAQTVRPGQEPPPLPEFAPEAAPEPALTLPPAPVPEGAARERLSAGLRVFVKEFRVTGSSVFAPDELAALTAPYANREIGSEELLQVRDAITRHYVDRGYLSSGALIPDQDVSAGVIEIQVIEGELVEIAVEGAHHLRESYVRDRLWAAAQAPVNVERLEERLRLLQEDERIRRVQAELLPTEVRGQSLLHVRIEEASPYQASLAADNDRSPLIGAAGGRLQLGHRSLTGNGDTLEGWLDKSDGLEEWDARYALPLNARDTTLALHFRTSEADVIDDDFEDLDISSESTTYGVELRHPLLRAPGRQLWLGLVGEIRTSKSFLFGDEFQFLPACEDGRCKLSILRAVAEWTARGPSQVAALRSMLSFGFDAFGASENELHAPGAIADGTFAAWLGQAQYARRFSERWASAQLLLRADAQIAQDPLLPLEQFSVGGAHTVRGYRANQIVRDNALVASAELRIPLLRSGLGRDLLELAPFVDVGRGWNEPGVPEAAPRTLASAGVGLRASPLERLWVAVYWGGRLRDVEHEGEHDLQDSGFSFEVVFAPR